MVKLSGLFCWLIGLVVLRCTVFGPMMRGLDLLTQLERALAVGAEVLIPALYPGHAVVALTLARNLS